MTIIAFTGLVWEVGQIKKDLCHFSFCSGGVVGHTLSRTYACAEGGQMQMSWPDVQLSSVTSHGYQAL